MAKDTEARKLYKIVVKQINNKHTLIAIQEEQKKLTTPSTVSSITGLARLGSVWRNLGGAYNKIRGLELLEALCVVEEIEEKKLEAQNLLRRFSSDFQQTEADCSKFLISLTHFQLITIAWHLNIPLSKKMAEVVSKADLIMVIKKEICRIKGLN